MTDVSTFFGTGYKEKEPKPKKESKSKDIIPSEWSNVAINVMGKLYEGNETIEIHEGDVIVDDVKVDKMPVTSGTWTKTLKGVWKKNPKHGKKMLRILVKCDMIV